MTATATVEKRKSPNGRVGASPPVTKTVTITIPICAPDPESYIANMSGRINTRLDREQREAFKRLHSGLRESNAQLANGRPVDGASDVLRWLFERVQTELDGVEK